MTLNDDQVEFEIQDAMGRGDASQISEQSLDVLKARTRAEGRCGSLQTSHGLPCRRKTALGFTVCRLHGSRAPQTFAKAERLLISARMPAIEYLLSTVEQGNLNQCSECGFPRGDVDYRRTVIGSAKLVLDRTGMGPRATLDVNAKKVDDSDALVELMTDAERVEAAGLLARLEAIKAAVRLRQATEGVVATRPALPSAGGIEGGLATEWPGGRGAGAEVLDAEFKVEHER